MFLLVNMDKRILKKMNELAERFFGTNEDPDQIPIGNGSLEKLQKLSPAALTYKLEDSNPISWVVIVPTSSDLADKFLNGKITEKLLLDLSEPRKSCDALYLCAVFTVPEHRNKGYALEMLKRGIENIPHAEKVRLFAWPYSPEGNFLIKKLEKELNLPIELKSL